MKSISYFKLYFSIYTVVNILHILYTYMIYTNRRLLIILFYYFIYAYQFVFLLFTERQKYV